MTYVHEDIINHKSIKGLSFVDDFNHCLATEIQVNNTNITILNIYRSPSNLNDTFLSKFENIIEKAKSKLCYVLGDMNYNLINMDKHTPTNEYFNLTAASFKPLITKPTRISDTNETLIDHIWTNNLSNATAHKSHIILTDVSDHLPCITTTKNPDHQIKGYMYITKRLINDTNRQKFTKKISKIKDILLFQASNRSETKLETRYNNYFNQVSAIYNECFPLTTKKIHSKTLSKPWITTQVKKLIDKKNKLFSIKNKNKTDRNKKRYKIAKKHVEKVIKEEKNKYYKNLLENTNNNIKQKWEAIRLIINRKKTNHNNCTIPNTVLGQHYSTVAEKLAEKLPNLSKEDIPSTSKINQLSNTSKNKFSFNKIPERQIYELILKLDSTKGPGTDNLDIKSLKSIANIISKHLEVLFNDSLSTGIYPQCFKISKCIPIYKGTPLDPTDPINYRPISILSALNKVFERILHDQLSKYMERNNLLPNFQYGYRKQHNTSQAILDYVDYITKARANKLTTIAVFMDLSKAFDTVDKTILRQKLEQLGITDLTSSLINSYMSDRKFCMTTDKEYYNLKYGVPQGSILGPLLFIMYISDMTDITKYNKTIVYADDTTVLVSGRTLTETKQHCNDILTRFHQYFTCNKLSINPSKTKYMIYKPFYRYKKNKIMNDTTSTKIIMDGIPLEKVTSIKFLGVNINDQLKWDDHKRLVHNKVSKTLGILYKCRSAMNDNECMKMYKTFIEPYFLYAIEVWGHSVKAENDILIKLQSKVLRILFNCHRSTDAWRHADNKISNIKKLYINVIKKLCTKHHYQTLPSNFSENIMPKLNINQLENKISRISLNDMYNYKTCQEINSTPFKTNCIKNWNSLSFELKTLPYSTGKAYLHRNLKTVSSLTNITI